MSLNTKPVGFILFSLFTLVVITSTVTGSFLSSRPLIKKFSATVLPQGYVNDVANLYMDQLNTNRAHLVGLANQEEITMDRVKAAIHESYAKMTSTEKVKLAEHMNSRRGFDVMGLLEANIKFPFPCLDAIEYKIGSGATGTEGLVNPLWFVGTATGFHANSQGRSTSAANTYQGCFVFLGFSGQPRNETHDGYDVTRKVVDKDSLFILFSQGKGILDKVILMLVNKGYLSMSSTLRYILREVLPNFGVDGAENITLAEFLQFQGGLSSYANLLSLQNTQWEKASVADFMEAVRLSRPYYLPKPAGSNWYPVPGPQQLSANRSSHGYSPILMGTICKLIIEAANPLRQDFLTFMNSSMVRGIVEDQLTRSGNGLPRNSRYVPKYQLIYKFPTDTQELATFHANRQMVYQYPGANRTSTAIELSFVLAQNDFNRVENKGLLIAYEYLALLNPLPPNVFPYIPQGIPVPLIADNLRSNFDNPAFAVWSNAATLASFTAMGANAGTVPGTNKVFIGKSQYLECVKKVPDCYDHTMWVSPRCYAQCGGIKPSAGQSSSCLPDDTITYGGLSDCFSAESYSQRWGFDFVTSDMALKKGENQQFAPMGSAILDAACRNTKLIDDILTISFSNALSNDDQ